MKMIRFVGVAMLMLALYSPVNAEGIYTWKDENGVLHFTDSPSEQVLEKGKAAFDIEKRPTSNIVFSNEDTVDERPSVAGKVKRIMEHISLDGLEDTVYGHISQCMTTKVIIDRFSVNEYTEDGWTPLTLAITCGCANIVKYLIHKGADVNLKHREGFTPLHLAIHMGDKKIVGLLISAGADMDHVIPCPSALSWHSTMAGSPLETALRDRNEKMLELLLSKGADYNKKNQDGKSPVDLAKFWYNRNKIEDILQTHHKDVAYKKELSHKQVTFEEIVDAIKRSLHPKSGKKSKYYVQVEPEVPIQMINDNLQLIFNTDRYGNTLLHYACKSNEADIVNVLLGKGLDVNQRNNDGETPLHYSRMTDVIRPLLDHGADINAKNNDGETLLHVLVKYSSETNVYIMREVIKAGCNKYVKNKDGKTPYQFAVGLNRNQKILDMLN